MVLPEKAVSGEPIKGVRNVRFRMGRLPEILLILLMAVILCDLVAGVVSRYMGRHAFPWTEELGAYCFLWLTFIGSAVGVLKGNHFAIPVFVEKMPPRARYILQMVGGLSMATYSMLLIISGVKIVKVSSAAVSHTLEISMSIPFASMPIGGALMLLCSVLLMAEKTRSFRQERSGKVT
jgi:TRAP-type C4-dicarboxylate transport system permease small subunit